MQNENNFHVISEVQKTGKKLSKPVFVYVGTIEDANAEAIRIQKGLDSEDRVRSKMQRKREVRIDSVNGQIGQKILEKVVSTPTLIGVDPADKEGDKTVYADVEDGVVVESGNLYDHEASEDE